MKNFFLNTSIRKNSSCITILILIAISSFILGYMPFSKTTILDTAKFRPEKEENNNYCYIYPFKNSPGDTSKSPHRSKITLLENDKPLFAPPIHVIGLFANKATDTILTGPTISYFQHLTILIHDTMAENTK